MRTLFCLALALTCTGGPTRALTPQAGPPPDVDALAKASQNPVSSLISVPLQFNFNTGGDLEDRTLLTLNFQPVIPFKATTNWNVITRTIVPISSFPGPECTRYSGVGDIQMQVFFSRRNRVESSGVQVRSSRCPRQRRPGRDRDMGRGPPPRSS
jgi:hypothetical protein